MMSLTSLGIFHTVIGLAALVSGAAALASDREISLGTRAGRIYLLATFVTAATALGIFQRGGFGPPHTLALLTLAALAVGLAAEKASPFGSASRYVQAVSYTTTLLFHLIPGFTESLTRLPAGAPIAASQEAPILQRIFAVLLVAYLVGVVLQIRWLRARRAGAIATS